MKKTFLLFSTVFSLFFLCSCVKNNIPNNLETTQSDSNNTVSEIHDTIYKESPDETTTENSIDNTTQANTVDPQPVGGSDDDYFGVRKYKYRYNYYHVPYQFVELVGKDNYFEWYNSLDRTNFYSRDEMLIVSFIKNFNIDREDFDRANEKNADVYIELGIEPIYPPYKYPVDYMEYSYNNESYEIYNADIIYTFDNELINEYYARPPELIIENGTNALGETVE